MPAHSACMRTRADPASARRSLRICVANGHGVLAVVVPVFAKTPEHIALLARTLVHLAAQQRAPDLVVLVDDGGLLPLPTASDELKQVRERPQRSAGWAPLRVCDAARADRAAAELHAVPVLGRPRLARRLPRPASRLPDILLKPSVSERHALVCEARCVCAGCAPGQQARFSHNRENQRMVPVPAAP